MSVLIIVKRFVSIRIECMNYSGQNLLVKEYFSTSDGIVEQDDES